MARILLSRSAESDLEGIYAYTLETWGVVQFGKYREAFDQAFATLLANPYPVTSRRRDDLVEGCRLYHVLRHYLFYRVRGETIEVGRILHERMDFERHISEQDF